MVELEQRLITEGYLVANIDYPSRQYPVEELSRIAVGKGIDECARQNPSMLNFVTHSLGGILVWQYLKLNKRDDIGRVVMLGPPNRGSEVVDELRDVPGFELLNGPAGMQLGTHASDIPGSLGPVDFELGVIAGTRSINLLLSSMLPGEDDGKVTIDATRVDGMKDFVALPVTHPFMMKNDSVIEQVVYFLHHGQFDIEHSEATQNSVGEKYSD